MATLVTVLLVVMMVVLVMRVIVTLLTVVVDLLIAFNAGNKEEGNASSWFTSLQCIVFHLKINVLKKCRTRELSNAMKISSHGYLCSSYMFEHG